MVVILCTVFNCFRSLGCLRPKRSQGEKPFMKKTAVSTNSSHILAAKYYGPSN